MRPQNRFIPRSMRPWNSFIPRSMRPRNSFVPRSMHPRIAVFRGIWGRLCQRYSTAFSIFLSLYPTKLKKESNPPASRYSIKELPWKTEKKHVVLAIWVNRDESTQDHAFPCSHVARWGNSEDLVLKNEYRILGNASERVVFRGNFSVSCCCGGDQNATMGGYPLS